MTKRDRRSGFSLLEVLATLALMALSLALVVPSFSTAITRIDQRSALSRVQLQLAAEKFRAVNEGISFEMRANNGEFLVTNPNAVPVDADRVRPLRLQSTPGWTLQAENTLIVSPSQGCAGGPLLLSSQSGEIVRLTVDEQCVLSRAGRGF